MRVVKCPHEKLELKVALHRPLNFDALAHTLNTVHRVDLELWNSLELKTLTWLRGVRGLRILSIYGNEEISDLVTIPSFLCIERTLPIAGKDPSGFCNIN
jgi:hypothetical protein